MKYGYLSQYFTGAGTKILTRVDATVKSNQHEVGDGHQGNVLKKILGNEERRIKKGSGFPVKYIWLEDEQAGITANDFASWYDTRKNDDTRSPEWRLYYKSNAVTKIMDEGNRLFIARKHDGTILFIVTPEDSSIEGGLLWLFGLNLQSKLPFSVQEITKTDDTKLDFTARFILDEIGVEFEDPREH